MRLLLLVFIAAVVGGAAAQAQPGTLPLLIPVQPAPPPPPPVAPAPVPSAVTPVPTPSYGVPSNIDTSTPLYSSSRVIYRQSQDYYKPRDNRVAKAKHYKKKRRHCAN